MRKTCCHLGLISGLWLSAVCASEPQAVRDGWSYKGRGTNDTAAGEGVARLVPPGDTDGTHVFDWNLYDLPRGRYRVTVRVKLGAAATTGAFSIYANTIPFGSGKGWGRTTVLQVKATEFQTPGQYETLSAEFVSDPDWPYTYWFFRLDNRFPTEMPVWLDHVDLALLEKLPPVSRPTALQTWRFDGQGMTIDKLKWTVPIPPGRYEVESRLTMQDTTGDQIHGIAAYIRIGPLDGYYVPKPSSFRPNVVETFRYPFEMLEPSAEFRPLIYGSPGGRTALRDLVVDGVEVRLLERYTEPQLVARNKLAHPVTERVPHPGHNVWLVHGLYAPPTGVPGAVEALGWNLTRAWFRNYHDNYTLVGQVLSNLTATSTVTPVPSTPRPVDQPPDWVSPAFEDRIMAYDVVVLHDLPCRLLTLQQRVMLHDYVQAGGGLLVVGGMYGLERSGYQQSELFDEILPVTLAATNTLHQLTPARRLQPARAGLFARDLSWSAKPVVGWMHTVTPKPGAQVQLWAGKAPVLVTWQVGRGRVAVLAAPPYGAPPCGQVGYWDWPGWTTLMQRLVIWLAGKES